METRRLGRLGRLRALRGDDRLRQPQQHRTKASSRAKGRRDQLRRRGKDDAWFKVGLGGQRRLRLLGQPPLPGHDQGDAAGHRPGDQVFLSQPAVLAVRPHAGLPRPRRRRRLPPAPVRAAGDEGQALLPRPPGQLRLLPDQTYSERWPAAPSRTTWPAAASSWSRRSPTGTPPRLSLNYKIDTHQERDDTYLPFAETQSYTGSVGLEDEMQLCRGPPRCARGELRLVRRHRCRAQRPRQERQLRAPGPARASPPTAS